MPPERFNYKKGYILPVNNKTPQYCEVLLPAPSRNQVKEPKYIQMFGKVYVRDLQTLKHH